MKKYLMSGIAAIAVCAAFTSCSKENLYDENAVIEKNEMAVREAYAQAFEKAFGKVGANVDWGFGPSRSNTRAHANGAIDVNGNEWLPENVPAVEDPAEVNAIYDYAHHTLAELDALQLPYSTTAPQNLNGYYVTQVRSGMNADNVYDAFDGTHLENCGEKMNFLQIKFDQNAGFPVNQGQNQGWEHINNFNASFNINHGAATSKDFGNTKVVDKGAFDFAYYNSVDSKFHNNWILVDGYYITNDHRFQNFYYVCFDFEGTPNCISKIRFKYNGTEYNTQLDGAWTAQQAVEQNLQVTLWNGTKVNLGTDIETDFKAGQNGVYQGLQVESVDNGDKKFDPDERHTDWIIRITKGPREIERTTYRVIAEDLNAQEISDFDFNDVVFDVIPNQTGTAAKIELLAAGGIYRLTVGDDNHEVHQAFGEQAGEDGLYPMINTNPWNPAVKVTLFDAYPGDFSTDEKIRETIQNITITVYKPDANGVITGYVLTATRGEAACKILVDNGFGVIQERHNIADQHQRFTSYVRGEFNGPFWWVRDAQDAQ